jgi:hypothetical protein
MRKLVEFSFGFFVLMTRLLLILLTILPVPLMAQFARDVRVVEETGTSVTLEFTPRVVQRSIKVDGERELPYLTFEGAIVPSVNAGSLLIPYRAVPLVFPSHDVSVEIIAIDSRDEHFAAVPRAPHLKPDSSMGLIPFLSSVQERTPRAGWFPSVKAELVDVAESRGMLLGTLKIYPIQFDEVNRMVRFHTRMVVRLGFSGSLQTPLMPSALLSGQYLTEMHRTRVASPMKSATDSPLAQGDWYKVDVKESGIYRLDASFFTSAGISLSSIGNIRSIRIFGQGGEELPEDLRAPRPKGLQEVARLVIDRNSNGTFDSDDFILFYGKSTRGWKYAPSEKSFFHYINHYTETNHYFITFGGTGRGIDMADIPSLASSAPYRPPDVQGRVFVEQELTKDRMPSGRQWWGQLFDGSNPSLVVTTPLPGIDVTKPLLYRFVVLSRSATVDTFRIQENNQLLGTITTYSSHVGSIEADYFYRSPVTSFVRTGDLPNNRSNLRLTFSTRNPAAQGWLDWIEFLYRQKFEAEGDLLLFASPDTTAVVEYEVRRLSSRDVFVFDVSDHALVKNVSGLVFDAADASVVRFQLAQQTGSVRELAVVGRNGFKVPANPRKLPNSNLTGITTGSVFIIISPQEFRTEANRLKAHRESRDGLSTLVVDVEHIYNEFSSGIVDPTAIRDFLRHALTTWGTKPRYVLLFGGANFDYKNIRSQDRNWIPSYQSLESINQITTYTSDDYFVLLHPDSPRISMALGRLPGRSTQQARAIIDKIIAYETSAPFDPWRNRITFVADDGLTSTGDDGSIHTYQADLVAQSSTPASFQRNKIYIIEHPTVNTSTGRRKPTANRALVDAINAGTLILNWTGHGNTAQWAHENIFSKGEDFPKLKNVGRPFLVVAATCDYARFDKPDEESAGELLLFMNGGSIATITAARVVYSFENFQLNNTLYTFLFQRDSAGQPPRLGDAFWATKQVHYNLNDLKHHLLGDPTLRLAMPRALASIDSINGERALRAIFLPTLGTVVVNGAIKNPDSSNFSGFNGRALVEMYDSKRRVIIPEWGNYEFEVNGSLLYRGEISVTNGRYRATFPIPKDVSYDGNRARLALYSWSASIDASGYFENIFISGTSASAGKDSLGPDIVIRLEDMAFQPGDIVGPNPKLFVDLSDESGINTSTAGIGHRLEAVLTSLSQSIDLSAFYRGNLDTYQSGRVEYQLNDLPEGRHTLMVKAWDIHNNSSTEETHFEVRAGSSLSLYNVFNFPNPFNRSTRFTFQRTTTDPIDVEVKIYTVAGRLIHTIQLPAVVDRFVQIPWDGRDQEGGEVANGVYFYRIVARSLDGALSSEAMGKLSVLR